MVLGCCFCTERKLDAIEIKPEDVEEGKEIARGSVGMVKKGILFGVLYVALKVRLCARVVVRVPTFCFGGMYLGERSLVCVYILVCVCACACVCLCVVLTYGGRSLFGIRVLFSQGIPRSTATKTVPSYERNSNKTDCGASR